MSDAICVKCGTTLDSGFNCPWGCEQVIVKPVTKPHCCPVCNGSGKVEKPPYVPGDRNEWISSGTELYPCNSCKGTGIIWG